MKKNNRSMRICMFFTVVLFSCIPGLIHAQPPGLLGPPSGVAPATDSGIAPVSSGTITNKPVKPKLYPVTGMGKSDANSAWLFENGYLANPMNPVSEFTNRVTVGVECAITERLTDNEIKNIQLCNYLPPPHRLICVAEIVHKKLKTNASNVCKQHTSVLLNALENIGYVGSYEGGWLSADSWELHNWVEVKVGKNTYILDAFNQEYYSIDKPVPPYCGNNVKEKGEICDGTDRSSCDLNTEKCEACKCVKEKKPAKVSMGTKTKIGLGAAAVAALLLANNSGSGSNDTNTGNTSPAEPVTPEPDQPSGSTPEPTGDSRDGNYNVATSVASNPAKHPVLIQNLLLQLQIVSGVLTITQLTNNPNFPREIRTALAGAAFNALVTGNYSGFNTVFQLVGTINALNQLTFQIIVGGNGSLPTGQPITYNAVGSK